MAQPASSQQHAWLYALLIEIDGYCRNENLEAVSKDVERAIGKLKKMVYAPVSEVAGAPSASAQARSAQVIPFPRP